VAGELVAGLDGVLYVVFAGFTEYVSANVQGASVGNNPLKYTDPTGHCINTISNDEFFKRINKDKTSELNIWVGDAHHLPDANKLFGW
jgi:hypothetical protein